MTAQDATVSVKGLINDLVSDMLLMTGKHCIVEPIIY